MLETVRRAIIALGLRTAGINYISRHIQGEINSWADLLSRWGGNNFVANPTLQLKLVNVKISKPIDPIYRVQPFKNMVWPDTSEIF